MRAGNFKSILFCCLFHCRLHGAYLEKLSNQFSWNFAITRLTNQNLKMLMVFLWNSSRLNWIRPLNQQFCLKSFKFRLIKTNSIALIRHAWISGHFNISCDLRTVVRRQKWSIIAIWLECHKVTPIYTCSIALTPWSKYSSCGC